jgi:hypothetical protein
MGSESWTRVSIGNKMNQDTNYIAEKYLLELMSAGELYRKLNPVEAPDNPERYNLVDEPSNFVLMRGKAYYYGRHPRTNETKWTYDLRLATILTTGDAERMVDEFMALGLPVQKLLAPVQKEQAF